MKRVCMREMARLTRISVNTAEILIKRDLTFIEIHLKYKISWYEMHIREISLIASGLERQRQPMLKWCVIRTSLPMQLQKLGFWIVSWSLITQKKNSSTTTKPMACVIALLANGEYDTLRLIVASKSATDRHRLTRIDQLVSSCSLCLGG